MNDTADDIQPLYLAIGYVIIKWSFIEAALDFAASTIYTDCGGRALRKQMPKFLRDKCNFIVKATTEIEALGPYKAKAENIVGRATNIKDLREDFAHSVLTHPTHIDGVYRFARLDAKEHNHGLKLWEFDVRRFPQAADRLESLATDAQVFAKSLEVAFHNQGPLPSGSAA
jgi:hypothetical protein